MRRSKVDMVELQFISSKGRKNNERDITKDVYKRQLEINAQMPIFIRSRQTFLGDGTVFEYSICYYPGNRYKYTVEL